MTTSAPPPDSTTMRRTWTAGSATVAALVLAGCGSMLQTPYEAPALDTPARWLAPVDSPQVSATAAPDSTAASSLGSAPVSPTNPSAGMSGTSTGVPDTTSVEAASPPAHATSDAAPTTTHQPELAWWTRFNDPQLNQLMAAVLARNNDLAAAGLRVRRAQLQAGLVRADRQPLLSGSGRAGVDRRLESGSSNERSFSWNLGLNYEVDLWGRLASRQDAADWAAIATAEDYQSTALLLVGTTLDLYWRAAFLRQQIATSEQSIAYARQTRELVQAQYQAGAVSGLEVAEADRNVWEQENQLSQLQQQLTETTNALAILLDGPPETVVQVPDHLPDSPLPAIDPGLPAELLARRPDLRAAEFRLRQVLAEGDASRLSYYPALSLTGSLGGASTALVNLLQNPIAALGAGLTLPFLQWQQMKLSSAIAETDYAEAVVNFRQTLYEALAEVENALSARYALAQQANLLEQSLAASLTTERLYEVRYRAGAVALKDWLDAQERRRAAELAVARNRLERYVNQVLLYQALGGDARLPVATTQPGITSL